MTNGRLNGVKFQRPVNICSRGLIPAAENTKSVDCGVMTDKHTTGTRMTLHKYVMTADVWWRTLRQ